MHLNLRIDTEITTSFIHLLINWEDFKHLTDTFQLPMIIKLWQNVTDSVNNCPYKHDGGMGKLLWNLYISTVCQLFWSLRNFTSDQWATVLHGHIVPANDSPDIQSYSTNTEPIFQTPFYYNSSPVIGDQLVFPSFSTFLAHKSIFRGLPRHPWTPAFIPVYPVFKTFIVTVI